MLAPTEQGSIHISKHLSTKTQTATVLKNLKSSSLISLGQICDDNCTIVMDSKKLYAAKTNNIVIDVDENNKIMTGIRNPQDGLYDIPISTHHNIDGINENYVLPVLKNVFTTKDVSRSPKIIKNNATKSNFKKLNSQLDDSSINNMSTSVFNGIVDPCITKNLQNFVPVSFASSPKINVMLRKNKTKKDLVTFLHGAVFAPVASTWVKAIKITILLPGQV